MSPVKRYPSGMFSHHVHFRTHSWVNTTPHWPIFRFSQRLLQSHFRKTESMFSHLKKAKWHTTHFFSAFYLPPLWKKTLPLRHPELIQPSSHQKKQKKITKATRQYLKKNTFFLKKIKIFRTMSSSFLFFFSSYIKHQQAKKKLGILR